MDEENILNVVSSLETAIQRAKGLEQDEKAEVVAWADRLYRIYGDYDSDNSENAKTFADLFAQLIGGNL